MPPAAPAMRCTKLPWLISALLLIYIIIGSVQNASEPRRKLKPIDLGAYISPEDLAKHLTALQQLGDEALPVLAVTTSHRTQLLSRVLRSLDFPVRRLVIAQIGPDSAVEHLVATLETAGVAMRHLRLPATAGPAEVWNRIVSQERRAPAWLIVDDHVTFEPGALEVLHHEMGAHLARLAANATNVALLMPGRLRRDSALWEAFVLLQAAVDRVGLFDTNFYPASQEGYDYLVRLSRAGLWLSEVLDAQLLHSGNHPSWAPNDPDVQACKQRSQEGRPYFALKWGHSDTVGVYDTEGHWDRRCDGAGHCSPAPVVLHFHPFNDPSAALSYCPFDPNLRECVLGKGTGPCQYNPKLLKRPDLLPRGEFDGKKYVEPETALRDYKTFVYLVQGGKKHPMDPPIQETADRDLIWLTYHDRSGDIYFPKSSWTEGRNRLLEEAMKRAAEMPDGGYLYYIFMDGDVIVRSRQDKRLLYRLDLPPDPYDRFEVFLRDWEPAVGTVAYWWTLYDPTKLSIHHNNDAVFSAHHRETLSFGLPYVESLDCHSWYYSQHLVNSLNAMLYNTRRVQFNGMEARNEEHVALYNREMMWLRPRCFALGALLPNSYLRQVMVVDPNPAFTPGQPEKRGGVSYIVPLEYIYEHFNLSHPVVKRALEFRQRPLVQHLLNASLRRPHGRFVEDRRTCDETGPDDHRCFREVCPANLQDWCPARKR